MSTAELHGVDTPTASLRRFLRRAFDTSDAALVLALAVLVGVLAGTAPHFASTENALNVLRQSATVGLVAFPMTLVIVAAEIDISVGSAAAFAACLMAALTTNVGLPLELAAAIALVCGALLGAAGGALRAFLGIPSFIVTLAMYGALRGAAFLITNAFPININSNRFPWFGNGDLLGIPVPGLMMVAVFAIFLFVGTRTTFGRSVYAVGGNPGAARLSGISVTRVRISVFALTGLLAALTGVVLAAKLGSATPSIATGLEFDVIAAVIIGGTSLYGGRGTMFGTLLGVLFISVLVNGMVLLDVNQYLQDVVRGIVILVAVLFTILRNREPAS
jgi:simple sugar transport system permease protein